MNKGDDANTPENLKALIVEDSETIARLLSFILEREGFHVEHCADGQQGKQRIEEMPPPAIVILDIMLPYVDGFELITLIRSQPAWADTPVLMLSTKGSEHDIALALNSGANDYIVKPFQLEELKARVRRLLHMPQ